MKLTDFIEDAGRPIAFYPKLRQLTGSTTATILLCQFIYWRGKESDPEGWLYKTSDDIEEETGLSYNEQKTARKHLKDAGIIEEHYARLDHTMRFRLNLDTINEKWASLQCNVRECDNVAVANDEMQSSLNELETTAETTSLDWNKLRQEAQERKDNKPDKSIVDAYVEAAQSEGMQKSNRYDAILSQIGVALNIYVDFKRWEQFIKFVDTRQQKHNESLDVFFRWLKEQKGFDISYWPPHKLVENWPRAFAEPEVIDKRHEL